MIILREKIFRRDEYPEKWHLSIDPEILNNFSEYEINHPKYEISTSKEFPEDKKKLGITSQGVLKKLQKDVRNGFLINDGPNGGDTHFLEDFSSKEFSTFSKKIDEENRFNYRVYPLEVGSAINQDTGERNYYLYQKIVYATCFGHKIDGVGDYLDPKIKKLHQYKHRK